MLKNFILELILYLCNHFINKIPFHFVRLFYYKRIMKFEIDHGSSIHLGCTFDTFGNLKIGKNSVINSNCRIDNRGDIIIGDNVSISENVIILTADHDMDSLDFKGRNKNVVIGDYVWIGTRAIILQGLTINSYSVVGAGSLLTKSIESYQVYGGIPAKFIKYRNKIDFNYHCRYKRLFK